MESIQVKRIAIIGILPPKKLQQSWVFKPFLLSAFVKIFLPQNLGKMAAKDIGFSTIWS